MLRVSPSFTRRKKVRVDFMLRVSPLFCLEKNIRVEVLRGRILPCVRVEGSDALEVVFYDAVSRVKISRFCLLRAITDTNLCILHLF